MCGIAGYYGTLTGTVPPRTLLDDMITSVRHRGPDAHGTYVRQRCGLAHARLSIIDLSTGQQPMSNEDGTIWVICNGEIFNYVELRKELDWAGHAFRSRSDSETIVHMYEEKGADCARTLNGDFAFAVWDGRNDQLVLARDRMGVRPLYYTVRDGALFFASEMKALFTVPGVDAELDPVALDQCFTFWAPVAPRTPFKGIRELPPGHVLIARPGDIVVRPYWRLRFPVRGEELARSEAEIAEEVLALLVDATRIRLRADVPVGAYLSGGLDSTAITALIRSFNGTRLRTFSVGFEHAEFDETRYQEEAVTALGTDHQALVCPARDIGRLFPDVIRSTERPIVRTAPVPLFALSRFVRENAFKVVLTGEGADETFAGYDLFKEAKIRRFWARQPRSRWRPLLLRQLYPYLAGIQGQPQAYLEAFFRTGLDAPTDPFFSHRPRWSMTARIKTLFSHDVRESLRGYDAVEDLRGQLPAEYPRWHPLSQAQYLEAAYLLPGYILSSQGDRVAMAHAVEGRFPFLDHRVVELAARIPPNMKLKGLREKHVLRRSMTAYLPAAILHRPKQPFRAPDSQSFFGPGAPAYVEELLSARTIGETGYFDPLAVGRLVRKCRATGVAGFRDNMAVVGILSVQLLHDAFVRRTESHV
jgi:asparagine synthase (glutamine-hydrolysing)